jgi:hypothetical protein
MVLDGLLLSDGGSPWCYSHLLVLPGAILLHLLGATYISIYVYLASIEISGKNL